MFKISRYSEQSQSQWDAFVEGSRNATFLFKRSYMDYHSDRFQDHSLMVWKNDNLCGLLPANLSDDDGRRVLHSHGGITYGGLILPSRHIDASDVMEIFGSIRQYCIANNINGLDYKALPYIYATMPSQEDIYAIQNMGGRFTECNLSCCIDMQHNPGYNTQQKRNLKKGISHGLTLHKGVKVEEFHDLLSRCLAERYEARPVHTAAELDLLISRFPENIIIYGVRNDGQLVAAVCLYISAQVVHTQYICSSPQGRSEGALALLFHELITEYSGAYRYFDFGTSNEDHGRYLNPGLYRQKSALGGSGVIYPRYYLDFVTSQHQE